MGAALAALVARFGASLTEPRERAIWTDHLAAEDPVALGELGARFKVTKQRMGQIANDLKRRFRALLEQELGSDIKADWLGAEE